MYIYVCIMYIMYTMDIMYTYIIPCDCGQIERSTPVLSVCSRYTGWLLSGKLKVASENCHRKKTCLPMVIFHSYVRLLEGGGYTGPSNLAMEISVRFLSSLVPVPALIVARQIVDLGVC